MRESDREKIIKGVSKNDVVGRAPQPLTRQQYYFQPFSRAMLFGAEYSLSVCPFGVCCSLN